MSAVCSPKVFPASEWVVEPPGSVRFVLASTAATVVAIAAGLLAHTACSPHSPFRYVAVCATPISAWFLCNLVFVVGRRRAFELRPSLLVEYRFLWPHREWRLGSLKGVALQKNGAIIEFEAGTVALGPSLVGARVLGILLLRTLHCRTAAPADWDWPPSSKEVLAALVPEAGLEAALPQPRWWQRLLGLLTRSRALKIRVGANAIRLDRRGLSFQVGGREVDVPWRALYGGVDLAHGLVLHTSDGEFLIPEGWPFAEHLRRIAAEGTLAWQTLAAQDEAS